MNILEIAKSWGIKTNNPVTGTECIEAFAAAVIEDYKASLVPLCWMNKYENGEWGPSQTKSLECKSIPLYAFPRKQND